MTQTPQGRHISGLYNCRSRSHYVNAHRLHQLTSAIRVSCTPLHPSSRSPLSPSPKYPPPGPPAPPQYPPTFPLQLSRLCPASPTTPPPKRSPTSKPAPASSQTSPWTKTPSLDSPSNRTRPHPSRTQFLRPLSAPAGMCLHAPRSSSPTLACQPRHVPALHTHPQRSLGRKKFPSQPSSSSPRPRCSSHARSTPRPPPP